MPESRTVATILISTQCLWGLSCKGPEPSEPELEPDIKLLVTGGDRQSGPVATELPKPVMVQVLKRNQPVANQVVNFVVTTASEQLSKDAGASASTPPSISDTTFKGRMFAGTAITDSKGRAADYWILGARTDTPQRVEARAVDPSSGKQVFATFTATALPGPVASTDGVGFTPLPRAPGASQHVAVQVQLWDVFMNPAAGGVVGFTATSAGDVVSPVTAAAGADGIAQTDWNIGAQENSYHTLLVAIPDLPYSPFEYSYYYDCSAGTACSVGNGVCTDTQNDQQNCGSCGSSCDSSHACVGGNCHCLPDINGVPLSDCGGICVDLQNDVGHCGSCTTSCSPGGATTCTNGNCQCPPGSNGVPMAYCDGFCIDLQTSVAHCGSCGHSCPPMGTCTNGSCGCGLSLTLCGVACVELQRDIYNCGACGHSCVSGICTNGTCQ